MSTEETAPPLAAEAAETPAPEASPAEPASSEAASAVDAAAEALEKVGVAEPADPDAPDAPDLALKSEVLVEQEETVVEKKVVDDTPYASAKSFEELGLSAELLQGLYSEMKFERPSKIQGETLPMILTPPHRNLIAQAHNGSGKTTCFTLGMLSRVDPSLQALQALCICPTRELAIQNMQVMEKMGKYAKISIAALPGGSSGGRTASQAGQGGGPGGDRHARQGAGVDAREAAQLRDDEDPRVRRGGPDDGHRRPRVDSLKIMKHLKSSREGHATGPAV